jgi:hypothetical protein
MSGKNKKEKTEQEKQNAYVERIAHATERALDWMNKIQRGAESKLYSLNGDQKRKIADALAAQVEEIDAAFAGKTEEKKVKFSL